MLKHLVPVLCLMSLLLASLACGGGTSGSVVGSGETCRSVGGAGVCEGTYRKLSGTYGKDIEHDYIRSGGQIDVEVEVSVESGSVQISVESPSGGKVSAQAKPGQPGSLVAVAVGELEKFTVTFEATEGEAQNVAYKISYQIR